MAAKHVRRRWGRGLQLAALFAFVTVGFALLETTLASAVHAQPAAWRVALRDVPAQHARP